MILYPLFATKLTWEAKYNMKTYNITYTGWINFLIWFFPNQFLKKSVELVIKKGFADFKSDKYEGIAREVSSSLFFSIRYSLALLIAYLLLPEIFHDKVLWFFTMLLSANIGFHFVWLNHKITLLRVLSLLGLTTLVIEIYWYINPAKLSTLGLLAFRPATFFFFVFAIIDDFCKLKNAKFYSIKEVLIIFHTNKKGDENVK